MGCWDELCLICGLRPGGGPTSLFVDRDACLNMIADSLKEQKIKYRLRKKDILEELRKLLKLFDDEEDSGDNTGYEKAVEEGSIAPGPYFPFSHEQWHGWEAIAIGVFDDDDDTGPVKGNMVTTRLVSSASGYGGYFENVEGMDGEVNTDASTNS
ncbi:4254_t:CDS:2, partial [Acaulospora colombiana]